MWKQLKQEIKLSAQMSRGDLDHTVKVEAREEELEKKKKQQERRGREVDKHLRGKMNGALNGYDNIISH